jgi:endonuclease YncB( thermonuclease family)
MQSVPDDMLLMPVSALFFDRNFLWRYRAKPIRAIDGDTFVAMVDNGFYSRQEVHIRIADINTPERGQPGFGEALLRLNEALGFMRFVPSTGWDLRIITRQKETIVTEQRTFERYVADVFVASPEGMLINIVDLIQ